jgi:hypothetical protein
VIFGGRLRLLLHDAFLVLRTCHATAAERERALHSFRACGVLEKAEQHHLFDLYEIATGCRPRYPSDSTTPLRERVLEAARDKEILVIPGWEESDTPIDKTPARPEAKVAQQVMAREKELAFEGASYVVLPATSWKEFSQGSGRSFEVVRREVAKATLLRMSAQAATSDRKRALAEAAELAADGNVAFGGLFLARRRIERTFVVADETPVLTPSQMRQARAKLEPTPAPISAAIDADLAAIAAQSSNAETNPKLDSAVARKSDAALATEAARQTADAAQILRPRPSAAGALRVEGQTFTGVSGTAHSEPLHPQVQQALDEIPASARSDFHGMCAEPACISRALNAGVEPTGGTMSTVRIRAVGNPVHGTQIPPCKSCGRLLQRFGIKLVPEE